MYRVAILAVGMLIYLTGCWISIWLGIMQARPIVFLAISLLILVGYAALGLSILLEWNLELKRPDMGLIQAVWAVSIVILTSQFFVDLKPLIMLFGLSMIMVSTNRLDKRELIIFSVLGLLIYGATVSYHVQSGAFDPGKEIISLIVITMTLIFCPLLYRMETGVIEEALAESSQALTEARWRIRDLSVVDEESGAANRRQLLEVLSRHKAMADRHGFAFSVCLLDMENLKANGNENETLKEFVSGLRSMTREVDCVARLDVDRFVLVLCGAAKREAQIAVERIRKEISQRRKSALSRISIGVSDYDSGETIKRLMERADLALYDAKRTVRSSDNGPVCSGRELLQSGSNKLQDGGRQFRICHESVPAHIISSDVDLR